MKLSVCIVLFLYIATVAFDRLEKVGLMFSNGFVLD